jgi:ABC-2 type transport system ATP-binding protein
LAQSKGELICSGSLNQLLGKRNTYHIKGQGGNREILKKWIASLEFGVDGSWQGILQKYDDDFLSSLGLMGGKIMSMNLSCQSLEEFFIQQIQARNHVLN